MPKTNEECISVTYGYFRIIDSYGFLLSSLHDLVETLDDDDFEILKKRNFPKIGAYYVRISRTLEILTEILAILNNNTISLN